MKPNRNDPCPCGSGKKYKQCCLKTEQVITSDEFLWRRIRSTIDGSPPQLLNFAVSHFGPKALQEAWNEFIHRKDEPFAEDTPHMTIFMPWFFYDWLPTNLNTSVKHESMDGCTVARAFLDKKSRYLDPLYVRYLEQCCASVFGFYDVISVRPGTGFVLRDIITGEEIDVTEHTASRQTEAGHILFARVVKIDQIAMLEACASMMYPAIEKIAIINLRNKIKGRELPLTAELLREYRSEMLGLYYEITERLLHPVMPQLQNTDGEPLVFHKLIYSLACSPHEALDTLRQLNTTEDDESMLTDAVFGPSGKLHKIEFAWEKPGNKTHKSWDNTVLGHLCIEGETLTAEVNSEGRARKFKSLMEKMLPGKARYKTTMIETAQAMLAKAEKKGGTARSKRLKKEHDELNSRPEIQAQIAEVTRLHYRDWPGQKLPALQGKTPLQAVKTSDGKEIVGAILMDIEQHGKHTTPPLDPSIITELREKLGLS